MRNDGAYIQNNHWMWVDANIKGIQNGGGINSTGTLTVNGGAIRNCYAYHYGAGIQAAGTFYMTGGEIYGNECGTSGSAVMLGGAPDTGTVFTLANGKIHNNSSSNCGGVCVAFGTTFIMNGGEISDNYATNGGGIYLHGNAAATINAGSINNNSAMYGGGCGIEADGGTLIMNGGEMTDNTATVYAGGIYSKRDNKAANNHIVVRVYGGTILNNTVNGASQDIYNALTETDNVKIDGGSVGSVTLDPDNNQTVNPKNNSGTVLEQRVITVPGISGKQRVTAIVITDSNSQTYNYGVGSNGAEMQTDGEGKLYIWLPSGCTVNSVTVNSVQIPITNPNAYAHITHTSRDVGSVFTASVVDGGSNYTYEWQCSTGNGNTWTDAGTGEQYTVGIADIGKRFRVTATNSNNTYISGYVIVQTPRVRIACDSPKAGQTFTASITYGGNLYFSYQWKKGGNDINGATSSTYIPTIDDIGDSITVTVKGSDGTENTNYYPSAAVDVICNTPTFTVNIPETVDMTTMSFSISGSVSGLLPTQSIDVTVSSGADGFKLLLNEAPGNELNYTLYTDSAKTHAIENGGMAVSFSSNTTSSVPIYYARTDEPIYSGTYTDTLTFTVIFNSGS